VARPGGAHLLLDSSRLIALSAPLCDLDLDLSSYRAPTLVGTPHQDLVYLPTVERAQRSHDPIVIEDHKLLERGCLGWRKGHLPFMQAHAPDGDVGPREIQQFGRK
jgi:hypothetical protein